VVGKGGDGELERQQRSRGERRGNEVELGLGMAATQGIKTRLARGGGGVMHGTWSGGGRLVGSAARCGGRLTMSPWRGRARVGARGTG
jgi:hypothetical protein